MSADRHLTPEELRDLTGKFQYARQARELKHLGIPFRQRTDGRVLVRLKDLSTREDSAARTRPQLRLEEDVEVSTRADTPRPQLRLEHDPAKVLEEAGVKFRECGARWTIEHAGRVLDFWCLTGRWRDRASRARGRGIYELVAYLQRAAK